MPPAPVDPDRPRLLGAALAPLRDCARTGADEVLGQFPELGDRETQRAVDDTLDTLADLLREVDASVGDLCDTLRVVALSTGQATRPAVATDGADTASVTPADDATASRGWRARR